MCDAGYLLKQEKLARFFEAEKRLCIARRVNMKRFVVYFVNTCIVLAVICCAAFLRK